MNVWMAMKTALTVMDLVTREWARQLGVDECGVMVLMQLGYRESSSEASSPAGPSTSNFLVCRGRSDDERSSA